MHTYKYICMHALFFNIYNRIVQCSILNMHIQCLLLSLYSYGTAQRKLCKCMQLFCDLRVRIECNECILSMRTSLDFRILSNVAKKSSATGCKYVHRRIYPQTGFLREPSLDTNST